MTRRGNHFHAVVVDVPVAVHRRIDMRVFFYGFQRGGGRMQPRPEVVFDPGQIRPCLVEVRQILGGDADSVGAAIDEAVRRSKTSSSMTSTVCNRYAASSIFSAVVDAAWAARSTSTMQALAESAR
jgi:hypothetical protein